MNTVDIPTLIFNHLDNAKSVIFFSKTSKKMNSIYKQNKANIYKRLLNGKDNLNYELVMKQICNFNIIHQAQKVRKNVLDTFIELDFNECLKHFISLGHKLNANNIRDNLMYACRNGKLETLKIICEQAVDLLEVGDVLIIVATKNNHIDIIEFLISKGLNGDAAIKWASINGYLDIVKLLVMNKFNVNHENSISFLWAICRDRIEVAKYLLDNGAIIYEGSVILTNRAKKETIEFLDNNQVKYSIDARYFEPFKN